MNNISFCGTLVGKFPTGNRVAVNTKDIDRMVEVDDGKSKQTQCYSNTSDGTLRPVILFDAPLDKVVFAYRDAEKSGIAEIRD